MLLGGRDQATGRWAVENDHIRLLQVPEASNLVQIIDKRRGETVPPFSLQVGPGSRADVISTVQQSEEHADLILSATNWRERLTWHAWLTVAPKIASLSFRMAVFNRGWSSADVSLELLLQNSSGLALIPLRHQAEVYATKDGVGLAATAFGHRRFPLAPQATAYLEARILPTTLDRIDAASEFAAASFDDRSITIAPALEGKGCLLVVGTREHPDKTFQMGIDLSPASPTNVPLDTLPIEVDSFRVRDSRGRTLLTNAHEDEDPPVGKLVPAESLEPYLESDSNLRHAERMSGLEHAACLGRALLKMRDHDWEGALEFLLDATILRGDNPIAWWAKAHSLRHLDADPRGDLANAHYLAPLDPVLRADAFLSAPEESKPTALLDVFGDDPQPYLEVADLLSHAGQQAERVRWLEEAKRKAPCSLFDRLLAHAHRSEGREISSYEHLALSRSGIERATPFRRSELAAME
jgi:hypothetical protein